MATDDSPRFIRELRACGISASVVSIEHVHELIEEIDGRHRDGVLGDGIYSNYASAYFKPDPTKSLPKAKSLIVLSVPQPFLKINFRWKGQDNRIMVPPTYFDYHRTYRRVRPLLGKAFGAKSPRLARAAVPVKLLAARSGLARYGRNNITYVKESGSFHRLMAFYSEYDSPVDRWQEKEALPLCSKCKACINACPTKAIRGDRFVIDAERCISYHNEKDSEHPFPKWIGPKAHNCIVGCMKCQLVCPYNKDNLDRCEERGRFLENETEYLLRGKFTGERAKAMDRRLKRLGIDLSIFPRNLRVLLD